jgi:hypothetical protein
MSLAATEAARTEGEITLRLTHPRRDWEPALNALVLHARCPWCDKPISQPVVTDGVLTWDCPEGCNP